MPWTPASRTAVLAAKPDGEGAREGAGGVRVRGLLGDGVHVYAIFSPFAASAHGECFLCAIIRDGKQ